MLLGAMSAGYSQSGGKKSETRKFVNDRDEATIRSLLTEGYETSWNNHHPPVTADKVIDDVSSLALSMDRQNDGTTPLAFAGPPSSESPLTPFPGQWTCYWSRNVAESELPALGDTEVQALSTAMPIP
jgi:hypothetical protein